MIQGPNIRDSIRAIRALAVVMALAVSLTTAKASVTYSIANGGLESFNVTIDSTAINGALAGGILLNQMSSTDPSMPSSYTTVCTDIGGTLYLGQNYTYDTPPTPFAGQTGVQPNWGDGSAASAAAAIQNAAYLFYTYGQLTSAGIGGTPAEKAALQLAVWEALYNTTAFGDVTGARFNVSGGDSAAISQASTWISDLNAQANVGNFGYNGYLLYPDPVSGGVNANSDGKPPQELLIGTPVPEAPTVIAGVLLLLPLATSAFKVLRRKRTA